jgi:hypothetical protein
MNVFRRRLRKAEKGVGSVNDEKVEELLLVSCLRAAVKIAARCHGFRACAARVASQDRARAARVNRPLCEANQPSRQNVRPEFFVSF